MTTVNVTMNLTALQAFNMLLQTLHVELKENVPSFKVNKFGDIVCDYDDRGELYLALYHLATKICPNTEFRNLFEDPNTMMAALYKEANGESEEGKIYEQVGDAMFFLPEYAYKYKKSVMLMPSWLSTFNPDSATECFTAVQELKERLEG